MKRLKLYDAMSTMSVTVTDTGYEISSLAGTAQYDAWGGRTTVNGIPEYFPRSLTVKQPKAAKTIRTLTVEVKPEIDESALTTEITEALKKASKRAVAEFLSRQG